MFQAHLGGEPFVFVVAHDETGSIQGFAVAQVVAGVAELFEIAVVPDRWRRGIGTALVDEILDRCRAGGAGTITLEVRESNVAARALYGSRGFVEVGRRKRYYRDPPEDGLVLSLTLVDRDESTAVQ